MKGKGFSKGVEGTTMSDGTEAWLTPSGNYFCRAESSYEKREKIVYYSLEKNHIPLAKAQCEECKDIIESKMCGDFHYCSCGASFVDTDRWMPERHRYGGKAKMIK